MTDPTCAVCDGFGWVPVDGREPAGWYERDWRLLLDPTMQWNRCPRCGEAAPPLVQLHDDLALVLLQRLEREVERWSPDGPWSVGLLDGHQRIYRWRDLACLCRSANPRVWMLISPGGVTHDLDDERCRLLLHEAGAPRLRVLEG